MYHHVIAIVKPYSYGCMHVNIHDNCLPVCPFTYNNFVGLFGVSSTPLLDYFMEIGNQVIKYCLPVCPFT